MDREYDIKDIESFLDTMPYYVWVKDGEGIYRYVNDAFVEILNKKREDIIGKTDFDFNNEDLAEKFELSDQKVRESDVPILFEDEIDIKSTNTFGCFETFKQKFLIGGKDCGWIIAIARDTTLYKTIDDSFEYEFNRIPERIFAGRKDSGKSKDCSNDMMDEHKERIKKIIEELQAKVRATGIIIFLYEKEEKKLKLYIKTYFTESELPSDYEVVIDEEIEKDLIVDKYAKLSPIKTSKHNIEYQKNRNVDVNGYMKSISIKYGNELIGLLNVYYAKDDYPKMLQRDFIESATYRIGILIKNRMLTDQLRAEVDKKLELEKMLAFENLKTDFLTNLSHEFKTPINILLSASKMINTEIADNKGIYKDSINRYTHYITSNSYRLLKMVNNLFDITNIDKGGFELNKQTCNVVSIVEDITMAVVKYVGEKRKIVFDTEEEDIITNCDVDSIEKVMLNLLSNAVKNTDCDDLITVNIKKSADNKNVVVYVRNDGETIDSRYADVIFDRFSRLGSVLNRSAEGSGLGLCLSRALIQLHDGDLWVNTNVKDGCEFIFTIPICENYEDNDVEMKVLRNSEEKCAIEFSDIYSI